MKLAIKRVLSLLGTPRPKQIELDLRFHKLRRPAVAATLSIVPGCGQLYLGQARKGVTMLLVSLLGIGYPALLLIPLGIVDSFVLGRRLKRGESIEPWECFWNRHSAE